MSIFECHGFCPPVFSVKLRISNTWFNSSRDCTHSPELSPQLTWFILSSKVRGSTPKQYFKRSPVVASFPGDFQRINIAYIRLQDGRNHSNKKSSNATEIVCSSFGLISTLVRRSSLEISEFISQLRDLLNTLDLSNVCQRRKKTKAKQTKNDHVLHGACKCQRRQTSQGSEGRG